ncbi:unnamed protein product [Aphanomyces euteiches]
MRHGALGQLQTELNEAKFHLNDSHVRHEEIVEAMLACRRDIVSQKDAEIARLTDVVRHQDAVQDEMAIKMCNLEKELLSVRTEESKTTPMACEEGALDYTLLDNETPLHSDEAHDEATPDKNEEESSCVVTFNKTLTCGKLETIPEGSDVDDLECEHQPPPPQPRGRMPSPSVMQIRAQLNLSRKVIQTEEIGRLECHVREDEAKQQTTKICQVDAPKATSLIQAVDLKAYNVVELETNESKADVVVEHHEVTKMCVVKKSRNKKKATSLIQTDDLKAYNVVEIETNESKADVVVEHHEVTKMCVVKKSRNKEAMEQAQFTHRQGLGENDLLTPNERDHTVHHPSSRLSSKKDIPNNKTQDTATSGLGIRACVSPRGMKARSRRVYEQLPEVVEKKRQDELERQRKERLENLRFQRQEQLRQRREQWQARRDNNSRMTKSQT